MNYMKGCRLFEVDYKLYIGRNPQFNTPKENVIGITQVKYNTEDGYGLNSYVLLCPILDILPTNFIDLKFLTVEQSTSTLFLCSLP